jgi:TPR repeat protein
MKRRLTKPIFLGFVILGCVFFGLWDFFRQGSTLRATHYNENYEKGQAYFERRSWDQARYFMQKAYDSGEKEAGYYLALSLRYLHHNDVVNLDAIPTLLEPLAHNGRLDCKRELGFYYFDIGKEELGLDWLQKASLMGDPLSKCRISLYEMEKKNYQNCHAELQTIELLSENSMALLYQLGVARLKCDPQNLDFVGAMKKSAEMGYFPAQEHLGRIYFYPNPWIKRDWSESKIWLEKSAIHGYPPAMYQLGLWHFCKDLDNTRAIQWIERAALKGHTAAQYFMGRRAEQAPFPQRGVILSWYEKAHSEEALNRLGVLHAHGVYGLKSDYQKSHAYFLEAAQAGHAPSQNNLGLLYFYHTQDCRNSEEQALYWFELSAKQGYPAAIHNVMILSTLQDQSGEHSSFSQ